MCFYIFSTTLVSLLTDSLTTLICGDAAVWYVNYEHAPEWLGAKISEVSYALCAF